MRERKCTFVEALDHLRETRKADPNFLFCQQLDTYAREGFQSLSSSMAPTPQIGFVVHHDGNAQQQQQQQQQPHHSTTVSTASVATTGADSTPKGASAASNGASMSPEALHRAAASGSPAAPKVSPPANQPPLPSFLVGSGAFSVSVGDGAGLISFHSLDPADGHSHPALGGAGASSGRGGGPILPYGRPGMGPAGASSSQEASGPLAVPAADRNNPLMAGDTSSHAPPTVTSTAGGGHGASRMMEASLMTNPGAHDDEDLIPQQDSRATSQVEFPAPDLLGASARTQLPPHGSSGSGPGRAGSTLPAPVADGDDHPNFGRAHDILADSGIIGADGQLLLGDGSEDDE